MAKGIPRGIQVIEWLSDGIKQVGYRVRINRKEMKSDKVFKDIGQAVNYLAATKSVEGLRSLTRKEEDAQKRIDAATEYMMSPPLNDYLDTYIARYVNPETNPPITHPTKLRTIASNIARINSVRRIKLECVKPAFQNPNGSTMFIKVKFPQKELGLFKIEELTEQVATELIIERLKTCKKSTVLREIGMLQAFIKKLRYMDKPAWLKLKGNNPFADADKSLLEKANVRRKRRLEDGEEDALLEQLKACRNPEMMQIFCLAMSTGMRRGEVLNLKWSDILPNGKGVYLDDTKSSDRIAILNEEAQEVIKTIKKVDEHLFHYSADGYSTNWQRVKKRAKITNFRFHDCRREFISRILESLINPSSVVVAELSGFKDVAHVERSYIAPFNARKAATDGIKDENDLMRAVGHASKKMTQVYTTLKGK